MSNLSGKRRIVAALAQVVTAPASAPQPAPATIAPERAGVNVPLVEDIVGELLRAIGEDPDRAGLIDTPRRVAKFWAEFLDYDPGELATSFEETISPGTPVIVSGMRVHSLCEHHLMPFWADVTVAYVPHRRVLGLSKLARIAHMHAHKLQLQERLCHQILDTVRALANAQDVAVIASGVHSCMVARGIRTPGLMTSMATSGRYRLEADLLAFVHAQHVRKTGGDHG